MTERHYTVYFIVKKNHNFYYFCKTVCAPNAKEAKKYVKYAWYHTLQHAEHMFYIHSYKVDASTDISNFREMTKEEINKIY